MGELMLRTVCSQLRDWRERGVSISHVALNVSVVQLRDPGFSDLILSSLAAAGLEGSALEIEVTESLFAENKSQVARQLSKLAGAGVRIAIDDFGTGFSSMSLLREYPLHILKIDRAFIRDCHTSSEARALLKALVEVGHAMKLQVVAEGVEEPEQLAVLHELGCDILQGYLFSPALTAQALEQFIEATSTSHQTLSNTG
jgi:EAL domain-containing protein (putative c-di-GMP-specific phosphodiesterase class I)